MTNKYIKRQLVLSELGIPMDNDVQKYYDYFINTCENISIDRVFSDVLAIRYDCGNNSNTIFAYLHEDMDLIDFIYTSFIFKNFEYMFNLAENDIKVLMDVFIRYKLNL